MVVKNHKVDKKKKKKKTLFKYTSTLTYLLLMHTTHSCSVFGTIKKVG